MASRTRALPAVPPVRRSVLPGGLRVVSEQVPGVRSVALGIWVAVGSRDERPALHGASHFLEHLLFKGTERRSALEISSLMDAVGGEMNAFTAKEYTCYYARVLDEDLPLAVDVLCDLLTGSLVTPEDVEVERGVILEEIAMHDDDPGDVVHDTFAEALWGSTPLGRNVIGSVESIESLTRAQIDGFYRRRYDLPHVVVAASGAVDHDEVVALLSAALPATGDAVPAPLRSSPRPPRSYARVLHVPRRTGQANLVLGTTALPRDDPQRFALSVLATALGGGMSSRLFQSVREERGLAYSVYAYTDAHSDTGAFGVYAGCAPGKVGKVLDLVRAELAEVAEKGVTDEEVARAQGNLRGSLVLNLEDTGSRMSRLGKAELVHAEVLTTEGVLERVRAVTPDDVRAVARDVLDRPLSLAVIGPYGKADLEGAIAR